MFVNIISMFTAILLCTLHNILIGSTKSWVICLRIFPVLFFNFCHPRWPGLTIVDCHIFVCIYHLGVTCIETHIFVPNFSISHIFISILIFFCCFLILGDIFTFHLQYFKKFNQHNIYAILEKISCFSCFIFGNTRLQ